MDPELSALIGEEASSPVDLDMLPQSRAVMAESIGVWFPAPPDAVEIVERMIPGPAGAPDVRLVITRAKGSRKVGPAFLHIHGGGYVMGSPEINLATDAAYALELGATVVSVGYRLSPETPHPGPVEDCYAALCWLNAEAEALGADPRRIVVTGESAGGGLAAALVLLARDRGEISVAFQHLLYPMLDDRTAVCAERSPYLGQFVWTQANNFFGWTSLLGGPPGGADVSAYAAAARADNVEGLPPTFIACGAIDLFLLENMDYARRLMLAGVPTELHIYPGAPHAFDLVDTAQVARAYSRDSMSALKRAVGD
ncbi:alpha/beta hydrolase [Paraburkholderia sacchari]|uniref:alpha/beta hydrolase n=1 Tax=Paraburkholderia sacchari TaxID=159450 RepID=UPI0039A4497D